MEEAMEVAGLAKRYGDLSGGERRRLDLAFALVGTPS